MKMWDKLNKLNKKKIKKVAKSFFKNFDFDMSYNKSKIDTDFSISFVKDKDKDVFTYSDDEFYDRAMLKTCILEKIVNSAKKGNTKALEFLALLRY